MAGGSFIDMLDLSLFFVAQWFLGRLFKKYHLPSIVAEMFVGIVMGPFVLDIVPYANRVPENIYTLNQTATNGVGLYTMAKNDHPKSSILELIGNLGVALMIFESGMHLQFDTIRRVGKEATIIAVIGTFFPILAGFVTALVLGYDVFPDGLAIGMTLAPTSVAISLQMLSDAKYLNSTPGQIIVTSAFIDDIFSLVLLDILINTSKGDITAGTILLPLVYSFGFIVVGSILALRVMPDLKRLVNKIRETKASFQPKDEVHLTLMCCAVALCGYIGSKIGSHLLGTFVAGLLFCEVPRSGLVWTRQFKRILAWMVRLFFSAAIGFTIPVDKMFTLEAFWKGTVIAILPCIGGKLVSGIFAGDKKWMIGWAMSARGEFAYLVAQTAKDTQCLKCSEENGVLPMMLSPEAYSALLWALVWPKILAPIGFQKTLSSFIARQEHTRPRAIGGGLDAQVKQRFAMSLVGMHHPDVLHEVMDVLHNEGFDVVSCTAESDDLVDCAKFVLVQRDATYEVHDEKLHEVAALVKDAVNDEESQVVFEALDLEGQKLLEKVGVLQIKMMGDHHPDILHEIFDLLAEEKLDVMRALVAEHAAMDDIDHSGMRSASIAGSRSTSLTGGRARSRSRSSSSSSSSNSYHAKVRSISASKGRAAPSDMESIAAAAVATIGDGEEFFRPQSLKETEIIYARHPKDAETSARPPIDAHARARLRERISNMILSHGCHGEVMLRMVPEEDAHVDAQPITTIMHDEAVALVTTHGRHHPALIHEVLDFIAKERLDVLHADIVQPDSEDSEDHSSFYVRKVDADDPVPATERSFRQGLREKLTKIFETHSMDGHVSVRPLDTERSDVISVAAARELERAGLTEPDDQPPRTIAEEEEEDEGAPVAASGLEKELEGVAKSN